MIRSVLDWLGNQAISRQSVRIRVHSALFTGLHARGWLRVCVHAWRTHVIACRTGMCTRTSDDVALPTSAPTEPPTPVADLTTLPPLRTRADLYRMYAHARAGPSTDPSTHLLHTSQHSLCRSYESLVDSILEWQGTLAPAATAEGVSFAGMPDL